MAQQSINVGTAPNDGLGDPIRTAYQKCNNNFNELYGRVQLVVPPTMVGVPGDTAGMIAFNTTTLYVCIANYDGHSNIWRKTALTTF